MSREMEAQAEELNRQGVKGVKMRHSVAMTKDQLRVGLCMVIYAQTRCPNLTPWQVEQLKGLEDLLLNKVIEVERDERLLHAIADDVAELGSPNGAELAEVGQ